MLLIHIVVMAVCSNDDPDAPSERYALSFISKSGRTITISASKIYPTHIHLLLLGTLSHIPGGRRRARRAIVALSRCAAAVGLRSPDSHGGVIACAGQQGRVHGIPGHAVHRLSVPGQLGQRLLALDVPNVDNLVLTAAGNEALVNAAEAGVDGEVALTYSLETAHKALVLDVPKVKALVRDVQQGQAVGGVDTKGHYGMWLPQNIKV